MPSLSVSILLSEAFSNIVLACLLEPLRVVRDSLDADITWSILTHDDAAVASSSGIRVEPDTLQRYAQKSDLVLVIGGDQFREEVAKGSIRNSLRIARRSGVVIGADTGAWLLASCGLLDGRRATIHWQLHSEFAETFLNTHTTNERFVRDGRFWTCGSAATALDLILLFIDENFGPAVALDVSTMFLHDTPPQADPARNFPTLGGRGSGQLRKVLTLMADAIETPLPLSELARRSNLSERNLSRLFVKELGVPPGRYYQTLRLARARELATHSGVGIEEIALRCGFSTASGLRKAYRKQYGTVLRPRRLAQRAITAIRTEDLSGLGIKS
ncbi:helix-turn-helix domain-containing protein [Ruegeria sediminis]|uniref:Helix-turn-helix domain-containing protein n=1 Tax=Ruegeria sediminis TaxID=2583820 RepID=A0ABY2X1P0_9RHOB|nr:helix-turn-helix domain-containing protein [Ruegeria sediminis]TMV08596.1 helix-turn-helix domain-containing protein [Ruegeria sediminis]